MYTVKNGQFISANNLCGYPAWEFFIFALLYYHTYIMINGQAHNAFLIKFLQIIIPVKLWCSN